MNRRAQTLDAAAMRGLDWRDNELERTAVGALLQRPMQTYDTDLRSDLSATMGRDAKMRHPGNDDAPSLMTARVECICLSC
jgi:hypothetical protein